MILISCFNFILVWFNLGFFMINTGEAKNKGKQGRKAKTQQNSHHPFPLCEIFAQHIPLCEFSFVSIFQKAYSRSLPKISVRKPQECEHCAKFAPPHFSNCWAHFDHFLKFISCVLYLGKSGVHRFKRCSIWSWNEEGMAVWRRSRKTPTGISQLRNGLKNSHFVAEEPSHWDHTHKASHSISYLLKPSKPIAPTESSNWGDYST